MSTDKGIGAVKLPNDPELRGAIEEYIAAIALAARRRELITAAQASIADADAEVQRTHGRCVELGIIPGARRSTARKPPTATRPIGAAGPVSKQALDAVAAGATTPGEVAAAIGGTNTRAAGVLLDLTKRGQVARALGPDGRWKYSPIGGEQ